MKYKKFKSIPKRYYNFALSARRKSNLNSIRGTKTWRRYFPAVNLEELIDRRQSLVTGCLGSLMSHRIFIYMYDGYYDLQVLSLMTRRLESLTVCSCHKKGSPFFTVTFI